MANPVDDVTSSRQFIVFISGFVPGIGLSYNAIRHCLGLAMANADVASDSLYHHFFHFFLWGTFYCWNVIKFGMEVEQDCI